VTNYTVVKMYNKKASYR